MRCRRFRQGPTTPLLAQGKWHSCSTTTLSSPKPRGRLSMHAQCPQNAKRGDACHQPRLMPTFTSSYPKDCNALSHQSFSLYPSPANLRHSGGRLCRRLQSRHGCRPPVLTASTQSQKRPCGKCWDVARVTERGKRTAHTAVSFEEFYLIIRNVSVISLLRFVSTTAEASLLRSAHERSTCSYDQLSGRQTVNLGHLHGSCTASTCIIQYSGANKTPQP